jgi:CDP-glucose 4,6-dehydratase
LAPCIWSRGDWLFAWRTNPSPTISRPRTYGRCWSKSSPRTFADPDALLAALWSSERDVVLHLAARSVVRDSYVNPLETISSNVIGTATTLDTIVRWPGHAPSWWAQARRATPTTSRSMKGIAWAGPIRTAPAKPRSNWSPTRSFFPPADLRRHAIAVATARGKRRPGWGLDPDGLVADVMRALLTRAPVLVRHPLAIRPWQHVLEPLGGYLTLASRMLGPEATRFCSGWNFGPAHRIR